MNVYRKGKSGCEISINHYKNVCKNASFTIQILENLPGNGYKNGSKDLEMLEYRLQREDYWIKLLRTSYPYGLNERTKSMNKDLPVGKNFPPLARHGARYLDTRSRTKINTRLLSSNLTEFFKYINNFPIKSRSNECRKLLETFKKSELRNLGNLIDSCFQKDESEQKWHDLIMDIIFTKVHKKEVTNTKKIPKYVLPIFFDNKGLEFIKLNSILNNNDIRNHLPDPLKEDEVPSPVYNLSNTIRNKIFNYKDTVNSININDKLSYGTNINTCDCATSMFKNQHHGHILTGDLRIIENNKLRKIVSKGPNYREPKTLNWKKCKDNINLGINTLIDGKLSSVKNVTKDSLTPWKNAVMDKVDQNISALKTKLKLSKSNPVLKQTEVIEYLKELHKKFVLVPIDKASNNVAIICKKYYVEVILKEIGVIGKSNPTYHITDMPSNEIVHNNCEYSKHLGFTLTEKEKILPIMYWLPKMHKNPVGFRFIIASKLCSTKQISKSVSNVFKLIYTQIENFHKNEKFLKNYNKFWVLQNSNPVINALRDINKKKRAKSISTYDFSTLYTKLPHDKLIKILFSIIDFAFKGGNKSFIRVSSKGKAFWGKKVKGVIGFSKTALKKAVQHLIENCYFTVGNATLIQAIGIPMGIDPAPFWANLFLYFYEEEYMKSLISSNKPKARHFHCTKRFIDDLCAVNDGGEFGRSYLDIYPQELELKVEHQGTHACFLNLDISILDNMFVYKLYDKRDDFPFSIVRMPHIDSNIPQNIFYSAMKGEFLRIARSTLFIQDFLPRAKELLRRMHSQGSRSAPTKHSLRKIIISHKEDFQHYHIPCDTLIDTLMQD